MSTDVSRFRGVLAERLGWTFADSDVPHLISVMDRRARATGLDRAGYLTRLGAGWPDEKAALTEDLTITETYFFRHGEQFRALAEVALPERIAARASQRTLRLLSVGCSSGEEPYTLAIVARRTQPDPNWIISALGVDANPAMLRKAASAHYSAWSLRETPDDVRQAYFHPHNGTYEVNAEIRRLVRWQQHNVADDDPQLWQHGQYDIIFCRNMLMYLAADTHRSVIQRMTQALAPGGFLFLGHTDSLGSRPEGLETQHSHSTFYYRRPAAPTATTTPAFRPSFAAAPVAAAAPEPDSPAPPAPQTPVLKSAPDDERILALIHDERYAEALAAVERAGQTRPRDRLLHGVLLLQVGRLEEAEAVARRLVDTDGLSADAHQLLGVCQEAGPASATAAGQYRLAAYLDPDFAMPRLRLGLLSRRRGDHRTAATELDRALHLMREERDDRIVLFGGGFGRIALTRLCRAELDACGAKR